MVTGAAVPHPETGLPAAAITEVPRRYGLHATMKPPFRLADGCDRTGLEAACADLCATLAPVTLDALALARLGRFLALRPAGDETALNALAAACVCGLDRFRAPLAPSERARRAAGLTPAQAANLDAWGFPFVIDAFRFHLVRRFPLRG